MGRCAPRIIGVALAGIVCVVIGSIDVASQAPPLPPHEPPPDPAPEHIPILVSDMWGRRLVRITDMGGTNWETGPVIAGDTVDIPYHITIDCDGKIYVADRDARRIVRMDDVSGAGWKVFSGAGSNRIARPGDFVVSVHVDRAGRLYFPSGSGIVRVDDMEGRGWVKFGPTPSGPGSFNNPKVITTDAQGRIYVTDTDRHRIARFDDMQGRGWTTFGSMGSGVGQFNRPDGIALDARGRIYVTDNENHRIVRINDMTGAGWVSFGSFGSGVGQFGEPHDLAVSASGKIYIADTSNGRVVRIDDMDGSGWFTFGRKVRETGPPTPECPAGCAMPGTFEFKIVKGITLDPAYASPARCEPRLPGPPRNLVASAAGDGASLSWYPPPAGGAVASYVIEAGTAPGVTDLAIIPTQGRATTFSTNDWVAGTTYVRVKAVNGTGTSAASNEAQLAIGHSATRCVPSAPTGLRASAGKTTVTLAWSPGSAADTSYVLEIGSAPGAANVARHDTANNEASLTARLLPGTYYVRVRAKSTCGISGPSADVRAVVR